MDIDSRATGLASILSNFYAHPFKIDGVACGSMEGFLQSLKFKDICEQQLVCSLVGPDAKSMGKYRDTEWKVSQTLWWYGVSYPRESEAYQLLITRAYDALFTNPQFQDALRALGNEPIMHSIGENDPRETVLTEAEFCAQLNRLREKL